MFGAACPLRGAMEPGWFDAYGGPLGDEVNLEFDEFSCLTLTISVPTSHLPSPSGTPGDRKLLPVMVYIHGGGAQEGIGHVDGLHDNAPLAAHAESLGMQIVTVNIRYRLN